CFGKCRGYCNRAVCCYLHFTLAMKPFTKRSCGVGLFQWISSSFHRRKFDAPWTLRASQSKRSSSASLTPRKSSTRAEERTSLHGSRACYHNAYFATSCHFSGETVEQLSVEELMLKLVENPACVLVGETIIAFANRYGLWPRSCRPVSAGCWRNRV